MPTPPYSKLLVSVNGGGTQSGGITIATGDSIQLSLESTVGVVSRRWEIYEYPVAFTVPAGWTDAGDGTFYSTAATPSAFVCDEWGKYLLRVRINNDNSREDWLDESTALRAPSPNGMHDLAAKEENQFSTEDAWVADQKANLRVIEGKFAAAPSAPADPGDDNKVWRANGGAASWQQIVNASVDASAAIAGSKIDPDFGSQDIVTTGQLSLGSPTAGQSSRSFSARQNGIADSSTVTLWSIDPTVLLGNDASVTVACDVHLNSSAGMGFVTLRARFRIASGTVSQVGTTDEVDVEDITWAHGVEYTVTLDTSAGAIRLRLTNASGDTIDASASIVRGGTDWTP